MALLGCSQMPAPPDAPAPADVSSGRTVYETPLSDGNTFSCSTCHALAEPSPDGLRRPGHPIGNATRRTHWKDGKASTFLDAVNSCVTEWMIAPPWTTSEPRFLALRDFLDAQATVGQAPDLVFEIVPPPTDLSGGDAARGQATFNETCVVCHGTDAAGTVRAPRIAGSTRTADYIAERIRTSGSRSSTVYAGLTGGVMPFWAKDRLADSEIRDLIAFIHSPPSSDGGAPLDAAGSESGIGGDASSDSAGGGADSATNVPDAASDTGGSCPKTNPRVGWTADLGINTGEGQVSGFVTMVDDCTLQLTNFSYDGSGIDVRVYGSKSSSFSPGFIIGPDLVGQVFTRATLSVTLPAGTTLDDLDWVAIWCVDAKANFGSGPFQHP
jgi:mono/diheme cytochrome c family protein